MLVQTFGECSFGNPVVRVWRVRLEFSDSEIERGLVVVFPDGTECAAFESYRGVGMWEFAWRFESGIGEIFFRWSRLVRSVREVAQASGCGVEGPGFLLR